jgi:3-isopropylmalate/(R)-2-methylmalate dehydratase small subunit
LPVTVTEAFLQQLFTAVENDPATKIEVNLEKQTIKLLDSAQVSPGGGDLEGAEAFEINSYKKTCLLNGFDDIDYLLECRNEIIEFEKEKIAI